MIKKLWSRIYNIIYPIKLPKNYKKELKEVVSILNKELCLDNSNYKFLSKKSFNILISKKYSREQLINYLSTKENFIFEGKGSSIGRLLYKNIIIYIKYKDSLSYGKDNELFLYNKLNNYKKPLNIQFNDYFIENITEIKNSSNNNNHIYHKSDLQLLTNGKVICNISLKKENNYVWESIIKRYKYIYDKFIFKGTNNLIENLLFVEKFPDKYLMINPNNNKPYGRIIIRDFPFYEDDNIIFGNEVPKPIIIENNFKHKDFKFENNILKIKVKNLYKDIEEIENHHKLPVLSFSRNMGKPYGIDFKCIPEYKTVFTDKANILEIPYKVLMDF